MGGRRSGLEEHAGQDEDKGADWQVDEEDRVPVEDVRKDAAEEHAEAAAAGHHEAENPHRLRAFRRIAEKVHDQRQRDRGHDCAAQALDRARDHQQQLPVGQAATDRRERERRRRGRVLDRRGPTGYSLNALSLPHPSEETEP